MKTPKNRQNFKNTEPPPNTQDLEFQNYCFDKRIGGQVPKSILSPRFYNGLLGDKTLTWSVGDRIRRAAQLLKGE